MTEQPHDTPAFQHAAEFTIAVTFVVAGGKRPRTADQRARREADRRRRTAVSCHNSNRPSLDGDRRCRCVYCDPHVHLLALRASQRGDPNPFIEHRCLCGRPVTQAGQRCTAHRDTELTVLDRDPAALQLLGDLRSSD